jgi:hypothetical protein
MISFPEVDIATLPFVTLADRTLLPNTSGIYFAIASDNSIQYIGKSINLWSRWQQHHRLKQLQQLTEIRIAWLECPSELLDSVEAALIQHLQPQLNGQALPENGSKVGRPKRIRLTERVNYKLDAGIRAMLTRIAARQGRNEGAQVEQLVLFYEAYQQLNSEGSPTNLGAINAKVNEIWDSLTKDSGGGIA